MPDQYPQPNTIKKRIYFWPPILVGTASALIIFTALLYFSWLNVITCLIIPIMSGFITLAIANPLVQSDRVCQIFLPWASLVLLIPFAYWKLKILILLVFPIASLGGWLAGQLFTKIRQYYDE
ncbi:hypothetical protein MTZ49_08305 [Entomomonas sp. E2T0]|uniref:hypothetical protein n=1 Tax=Entomomonas sp. E2T0 TaxID=2930213 RepID=UPI00222823DB|nr:hypothetical protein [Entomomonas sp. E2T0]UYZ82621.1 hypothetical protein MTZ49_08305 [Entomomonas sp. E2T0]